MSWPRDLTAFTAVSIALVLQVSVLDGLAWQGVGPDLVLLVVVAVAVAHGTEYAMVVGLLAGALLDLAPPADHVAGRWALALLGVGYVAGRLAAAPPGLAARRGALLGLAAASSFVGTSAYALSGLVLRDDVQDPTRLLRVVGLALVWDVAAALVVVPLVLAALRRASGGRVPVGTRG